jgi:hypothetical protein
VYHIALLKSHALPWLRTAYIALNFAIALQ